MIPEANASQALYWALGNLSMSDLVESPDLLERFHAFFRNGTPLQQQKLCPHKLVSQLKNTAEDLGLEDTIQASTRRSVEIHESIEVYSTTPSPDCEPSPRVSKQITTSNLSGPREERRRASKRRRASNHESVDSTASWSPRCRSATPEATYSSPSPSECSNHVTVRPSEISSPASTPVLAPDNSYSRTPVPEIYANALLLCSDLEDHLSPTSNRDLSSPVPASETSETSTIPPSITSTKSPGTHNTIPKVEPSILNKAKEFFQISLGARSRRAQYLVRAIQGFIEVDDATLYIQEHMWTFKSEIFNSCEEVGSIARFRRLYEGHQRIKLRREEYACADRFCYIFLEHDLDQLAKSSDLILSQGRGRKTAAFRKQAESISLTINTVRANRKAGRGYLHLLIDGGPGFVLLIGSQVSTIWERKLSRSDISLILKFLQEHLPDIYTAGKSLDTVASQVLVNGFVAYGWNRNELLNTDSALIDTLKSHLAKEAGEVLQTQSQGLPGSQQAQRLCVSTSTASRIDLDLGYYGLVESDDRDCSSVSPSPINGRYLENIIDSSSPSITDERERQKMSTLMHPSTLETINESFSSLWESDPLTCNSLTTGDSESDISAQNPTAVISEDMTTENLLAHSTESVRLDLPTNFCNVEEDELWHVNLPEQDIEDINMLFDVPLGFLGPYQNPISPWNNFSAPSPLVSPGRHRNHEGFWDSSRTT